MEKEKMKMMSAPSRLGIGRRADSRSLAATESSAAGRVRRGVSVLEEIVRVLKTIESHLRSTSTAKGGGGLPSIDEQRLFRLILSHVDYCILLHHTFKIKYSSPSSEEDEKNYKVVLGKRKRKMKKKRGKTKTKKKKNRLLFSRDIQLKLEASISPTRVRITEPFKKCLASIPGPGAPPLRKIPGSKHPQFKPVNVAFIRAACASHNKHLLTRHLVDILHSLEVLAEERGYAPPSDDEINLYREAMMSVSSVLAFLDSIADVYPRLARGLIWTPQPFFTPGEPTFSFSVWGHLLASSFELFRQYVSILEDHKARIAQLLSSGGAPANDQQEEDDISYKIGSHQLIRWQEEAPGSGSSPVNKTRLECLNIIISKLNKINASLTPKGELTDREFHLCAHIAEHVRAHLTLFKPHHTQKDAVGGGSCLVNVSNVKELAPSTDGDDALYSREQYLEDIVSYLRAFKPLFTADVLTVEESSAYYKLWKLLGSEFFWCEGPLPVDPTDVKETGEDDEKTISVERRVDCLQEEGQRVPCGGGKRSDRCVSFHFRGDNAGRSRSYISTRCT